MPERECDCPPWVVRCAHWEGLALWLTEGGRHKTALNGSSDEFGIATGRISPCYCGPHLRMAFGNFVDRPYFEQDFSTALAEFHRREAILLGREEAP